jgi:predicted nucleic acid-binding protein
VIVVDASLAVKWVVAEPQSAAADQVLDRYGGQLTAPDLIGVEVGGALVRRANSGELSLEDALAALQRWVRLIDGGRPVLHPVSSGRLLAAGELAARLRHPLKDCVYLALALELGATLATCDERFAAKSRPLYPNVKLLSDFGFPDAGASARR